MIQVIHRAFNILELIARDPNREVGLSEIADTLQLNHSTCANILKTLINRGYAEQSMAKKGYKLGYMAYKLTNSKVYNAEILNAAQIPLENLSKEINENVILSIISSDKRLLLKEITCSHEIQPRTLNETSVYRATTGRMILAFYSTKELNDFIQRVGLPTDDDWPEVKSRDDLTRLLDEIRAKQLAFTHNKNHVIGFATPLFKNDKVVASIGAYLPSFRFGDKEEVEIVNSLKAATGRINRELNK